MLMYHWTKYITGTGKLPVGKNAWICMKLIEILSPQTDNGTKLNCSNVHLNVLKTFMWVVFFLWMKSSLKCPIHVALICFYGWF